MHRPEELPPISQPPTAYHGGMVMSTVSETTAFQSIKGGAGSADHLAASSASTATWQQHDGLTSTSTSEMPSPSIRALDSVIVSSPSDLYDAHNRGASTISSSSSTMTLKRSYLRSSSSQLSYMSNSSRRESYLPHSPLNRDSIQIVPPQPLGFGGNMALATDQKTLAFSSNSGIGTSEDFTSGLVWTDPSGHGGRSRNLQRPQLAHQDRQRYLMEGPVSTRSSEAPSLLPSSQSSPVGQMAPLQDQADGDLGSLKATPLDSRQADTDGVSQLETKASNINPHLLGAKDSPLQRLQSNTQPLPRTRVPSDSNSNPSVSDASPILSPFVHHSSPASMGEGATPCSDSSPADQVEVSK